MDWKRIYSNLPGNYGPEDNVGINQLLFDFNSRLYAFVNGSGAYVSDNGAASFKQIKAASATTESASIAQDTVYFAIPNDGAYSYHPNEGLKNISPSGVKDTFKITADKNNKQLIGPI